LIVALKNLPRKNVETEQSKLSNMINVGCGLSILFFIILLNAVLLTGAVWVIKFMIGSL